MSKFKVWNKVRCIEEDQPCNVWDIRTCASAHEEDSGLFLIQEWNIMCDHKRELVEDAEPTKPKRRTRETQYVSSDWITMTATTINDKSLEEHRAERDDLTRKAKEIDSLLRAHAKKFSSKNKD